MILPDNFIFSQGNLQDFVECHRRFQLKYIRRLAWPGVPTEPIMEYEKLMFQGQIFHRLVHQLFSGIPEPGLSNLIHDDELHTWWNNFLQEVPQLLDIKYNERNQISNIDVLHPEVALTTAMVDHQITAKYDLIQSSENKLIILDWKTGRKHPKRNRLLERLQTRIYPFIMVKAGAHFLHCNMLEPEQVEMVYWYANFPKQPERFSYTTKRYNEDKILLEDLVIKIKKLGAGDYSMTDQIELCDFCNYRSLCERGDTAGLMTNLIDFPSVLSEEISLDIENIVEIEY
jgi:hypothetical protein